MVNLCLLLGEMGVQQPAPRTPGLGKQLQLKHVAGTATQDESAKKLFQEMPKVQQVNSTWPHAPNMHQ